MPFSTDGYRWTPEEGLKTGVPTDAVIVPQSLNIDADTVYDAIVVGAGYAGLRATRDLSLQGHKVLILEGRDRIGGRTCSVKADGYVYEAGGTWVHRNQALVWSEIVRYGFENRLKDSQEFYEGSRCPTAIRNDAVHEVPWTDQTSATGFAKFCNIDGQMGNSVFGLHQPADWLRHEDFIKWDSMSCQDRLDQIKEDLSAEEIEGIIHLLLALSKGPLTRPSYGEVLRWVALSGGNLASMGEHTARWKLADGQTALALAMFDDALKTGNLAYSFSSNVSSVTTEGHITTVTTTAGQSFKTSSVVVAAPLNCLADIQFSPALDQTKAEAIAQGHTNHAYKVCVEAKGKQWRNWMGNAYPHKGVPFLNGDGINPSGNSYLISTPGNYIDPQNEMDKLLEGLQYLHPELEVLRIFGMDYHSHPLSKGGWAVHGPGYVTKYLESLQAPAGNVYFASADWADVWRGFIDGALESGAKAAWSAHKQLRNASS
ncbi:unnamed protein product [Clonostachys byssicola]|uniref:Amine oxidase n=1 Tax=Clonostachys byssicola TaxID=160290 RepID=A0A9N9UUU9_9HYPO|nr:unnamed protein product [Clonostachys byssicola]